MRIARPVILADSDRITLQAILRSQTKSVRVVARAKVVLHAAEGLHDKQIAPLVGMQRQSVARWRERFLDLGIDGLMRDLPRGGRSRTARAPDKVREVIRLTTQTKPTDATHWSTNSMARAAHTSATTVRRIWREHGLKPHRVKSFKLSNDKRFAEKLDDIVGLYLSPPEHALVLSCDEKSQIQALVVLGFESGFFLKFDDSVEAVTRERVGLIQVIRSPARESSAGRSSPGRTSCV